MGPRAPGSAHARTSAQPSIDTSENLLAHLSGRGGRCQKKLINFLAISGDFKYFSFFLKKKRDPRGAGGVPQICFHPKSYIVCDLRPHQKFQKPTISPYGRKVTTGEREERKTSRKLYKLQSDLGLQVFSIEDSKNIEVHLSLYKFDFSLLKVTLVNLSLSKFTYAYPCLPKFN